MDNKETSNITVGYYHTLDDKQITISLEEYKELRKLLEQMKNNKKES